MSKAITKTKSLSPPPAAGEYFRLICMTGENKGIVYYINAQRIVLGRSQKADIPVLDKKSSREHCELVKHGNTYVMTDLGSQNGVVINDLKVKQYKLENNDKIIIGQTVYKFSRIEVEVPAVIDEDEEEFEDEEEDENDSSHIDAPKSKSTQDPQKRKKILLIAGVLLMLLLFMGGDDEGEQVDPQDSRGGANFLEDQLGATQRMRAQDDLPEEVALQLETHIQRGLREYREGNYFRAIREFNLALVLSPNHGSASYYLSKTRQRLDEDIEKNFERARREIESHRLREAINSYCTIMRMLQQDPSDQRYKDAEESLELVREQMGARPSEVRCISGR